MDQTKNSKPIEKASFTTRFSVGLDRALNSKTKWADKVNYLFIILNQIETH